MTKSWFEPYITSILTEKEIILDNWRKQKPTISSGRIKNFETWLLVELVNCIFQRQADNICCLQTNGNLSSEKIKAAEVIGLAGRKFEAKHLSPDIAIRLVENDFTISAELKTGLARKDLLNDLIIVKHYKKIHVSKQAEFLWVTLLPSDDIKNSRAAKSFEKTFQIMINDNPDISFIRKEITPWLILVIAVN
jgi:hypothetical protein